jgi:hypothetical protein
VQGAAPFIYVPRKRYPRRPHRTEASTVGAPQALKSACVLRRKVDSAQGRRGLPIPPPLALGSSNARQAVVARTVRGGGRLPWSSYAASCEGRGNEGRAKEEGEAIKNTHDIPKYHE